MSAESATGLAWWMWVVLVVPGPLSVMLFLSFIRFCCPERRDYEVIA